MVISRISKSLDKLSVLLLILITVIMTVSLVIMIFGRNFFNSSFESLEEISRFTLVWLTFFGSAIAYKRKEHMGMDFIVNKLKGQAAIYFSVLQDVIALILFALFIYYGTELAVFNLDTISLQSGISMGYVYSVIPVSGLIMLVHAIDHILHTSKRLHDKEDINVTKNKVSSI
ncbi:TRAP transporter small permease subunit [Virgibacillus dakarensis]|uniref:TRAP transporter small permease protein n=1 Tax=Lentibacillus populi TaxID=1827502 RepID=A0A9W5X644_9BACI|nr:TRAP transporter small permease [Lentibacillus populi]MTW87219.1 TRAP transporter small permease subunit [Virgibacillus dakarensis]GGB48157.1 TRAP transporter small permease protein [Lentibacillus populi]